MSEIGERIERTIYELQNLKQLQLEFEEHYYKIGDRLDRGSISREEATALSEKYHRYFEENDVKIRLFEKELRRLIAELNKTE